MNFFLKRIFMFLLLIGVVLPLGQIHAVWQTPPFQFPANGDGIAMRSDANGNAMVVLDNDGTVEAYYFSSVTKIWTGPTILGTDNRFVAMDMDPSGTALAAWPDPNDGNSLHSAYFDGTVWTPGLPVPFAVPDVVDAFLFELVVSMNGPNSGLATWVYDDFPNYKSSFFTSGSWGPTILIAANTLSIISADFSSNGTAVATHLDLTGNELRVSNFIGGVWQLLPGALLDSAVSFNKAFGRVAANGHAAVVWVDAAGDVKASSFFDETIGWLPAIVISATSSNDPESLSFEMAPGGTAVATWVDGSGVGYSSSYNGTTWSTPQIFANAAISDITSVSVNASGDALLLYLSSVNGGIYSKRLPLNGVWTSPEFLYIPSQDVPVLISSLSDNGFGFAAFAVIIVDDGLNYFATFELAPLPPAPPAGIVGSSCKNKFAMQTDCVHFITWAPSPTPSVIAYEVRRNGVVIGVVLPSTLSFIDHDRCKLTDIYTVTAIDSSGLASTPVVVVIP